MWCAAERRFYGVHGNSGYLFTFDPQKCQLHLLRRITAAPSQEHGAEDMFSYGYLGFTLAGATIYYLTGGYSGHRPGDTLKGESKGIEDLRLVTFEIDSQRYRDHGRVAFEDGSVPSYCNRYAHLVLDSHTSRADNCVPTQYCRKSRWKRVHIV